MTVAYSDRINAPKYKKVRFLRRYLPLFLSIFLPFILAVCLAIKGRLFEPRAMGIVFVFAFLLFFVLGGKRAFERDFDGTVTDKRLRRVTAVEGKRASSGDRYILIVTDDDGREHETAIVESEEQADRANAGEVFSRKADAIEYFRRGDRVRHHAGLKMYEKEDKSKDRRILCCGCLVLTDKDEEFCRGCGLPLLK